MEPQDQMKRDLSQYFCNQPQTELHTSVTHDLFCGEMKTDSIRPEGSSQSHGWKATEHTRFQSCNSRSFAMDARIRLDYLKSGCNSPLPCCAMDGTLYNYDCQKDLWESEPKEEESALDLVELLDVDDDVQDEESWLYESPKKSVTVEKTETAFRWCRHVLDNPSPEIEAACRLLMYRLDQNSSSHFRRPAFIYHSGNATVFSSVDKSSVNTTQNISDSSELNFSHDSINTNYRLEDITDVHMVARIQEASLRQHYVSTPAAASPWGSPESSAMLSSFLDTAAENFDDLTPGNKIKASSSPRWQPGLLPLRSSSCQPQSSTAPQSCQSPKLARLHQQVTQFKLLKLAQNQGRTRSPVRTSLRSLQAVRNSRSLEIDDVHPTASDQIVYPAPDASSTTTASSCWSPSLSGAFMNSVRDSSARVTAMKRLQRSQSVSPCRIPHRAKGFLSLGGRVFASPERSTPVAWARNAPSTQR